MVFVSVKSHQRQFVYSDKLSVHRQGEKFVMCLRETTEMATPRRTDTKDDGRVGSEPPPGREIRAQAVQ